MTYTPFIWPLLAAAALLAWLGVLSRRFRGVPAAAPFRWLMGLGSLYILLQGLAYLATDLPLRVVLEELLVLPSLCLPVALWGVVLEYTGRGAWLTRARLAGLLAVPLVCSLASLTGTLHRLYRYNFEFDFSDLLVEVSTGRGPLYWLGYLYTAVMVATAVVWLLGALQEPLLKKKNTLALLAGALLPPASDALARLGLDVLPDYNFFPFWLVFSSLFFAWALLRGRLLESGAITRRIVVDNFDDPLIVTDLALRVVDFNTAAQLACGLPANLRGAPLAGISAQWAGLVQQFEELVGRKQEMRFEGDPRRRIFELSVSPILDEAARRLGSLFILHDISTLKQAQAALEDSRARLANIIQGTNIGAWEWNVQTGETVFNERWAEIVGYSLAELAPISIQTWLGLAHPEDLVESGRLLDEVFARRSQVYDIECRMKHRSGEWVWVHDRGRVIEWTEDGKPLRMAGSHADITARKQAEARLQASELRYRVLFETLPAGVTLADENGQIVATNPAAERILGVSPAEHEQRSIDGTEWDIIRPDGSPLPLTEYASTRALREQRPVYQVEMGVRRPHGEYTWISASAAPVAGQGVVITYEDISARRQVETIRQERANLFHAMFEKVQAVMLLIDPADGQIVDANPAAAAYYGYSLEALRTMRINQINTLPPEMVQAEMNKALAEQRAYFVFNHRLASGQVNPVEVYSSPIEIGGRTLLHSIVHDVSARKQAETAESEQRVLAEALRDAAAALNSSLHFEDVLDRILENVGRVVPADSIGVLLLDAEQKVAREVRLHDTREAGPGKPLEVSEFPIADTRNLREIMASGSPLIIPDTAEYADWVLSATNTWFRSNLTVPILLKGFITGFLSLNSSMLGRFTPADARCMQAFADQAAVAIENARLYEETHARAVTDPLTGVFNRHGLLQFGEQEVARALRFERPLALLMADLDHFKSVNDTYGHAMGDRVLAALVKCCQANLRKVDLLARYGGEEFVFLLPETDMERALQVAERLREAVEALAVPLVVNDDDQEIVVEGIVIKTTLSLGAAALRPGMLSLNDLILRADSALYQAKESGRNRVTAAN